MKTILLAIAAMISFNVSAQQATNVRPQKQMADTASGCKWQKDNGRCTVFNTTQKDMVCRVTAKTTISKAVVQGGWNRTIYQTKTTTLKIAVPAKTNADFIRIYRTEDGEIIEKMEIRARCK